MPGALDGLNGLEIGQWVAGPFCGMVLSDLGAGAIKVKRPGSADGQRHSPPLGGCGATVMGAAVPHLAI